MTVDKELDLRLGKMLSALREMGERLNGLEDDVVKISLLCRSQQKKAREDFDDAMWKAFEKDLVKTTNRRRSKT